MKKITIVVLVFLLSAGASFAEGEKTSPFRFDADLGANLCLGGLYPYGEAIFVWQPVSLLAIGASADAYFGINAKDLWLAPLARIELGWFYVTGGPAFLLTPPDRARWMYPDLKQNTGVYFGLGLSHGLIRLGPGKLGFDARASYAFAPIQYSMDADNIFAALAKGIALAIVDVFAGIRLGGGITYSLPIGS